jgi:adenylate cyclase
MSRGFAADGADEEGTLERLKALRRELVDRKIAEHHGRIVKTTGDGLLVELSSVVDAGCCAVEVQREMAGRNEFRTSMNLDDIKGWARHLRRRGKCSRRVEALAKPGGTWVSRAVRDQVRDKLDFHSSDIGDRQVKNIARRVRVYRVMPNSGISSLNEPPTCQTSPPWRCSVSHIEIASIISYWPFIQHALGTQLSRKNSSTQRLSRLNNC